MRVSFCGWPTARGTNAARVSGRARGFRGRGRGCGGGGEHGAGRGLLAAGAGRGGEHVLLHDPPPGPVPVRPPSETPCAAATFFASGLALIAFAGGGRRGGRAVAGRFGLAGGVGGGGRHVPASLLRAGLFGRCLAEAGAAALARAAGSPVPPMTAIFSPTATFVPSGTRSESTPSSKASISMVALSVSTSAITSPVDTFVAGFLFPGDECAFGHGVAEFGHRDFGHREREMGAGRQDEM